MLTASRLHALVAVTALSGAGEFVASCEAQRRQRVKRSAMSAPIGVPVFERDAADCASAHRTPAEPSATAATPAGAAPVSSGAQLPSASESRGAGETPRSNRVAPA